MITQWNRVFFFFFLPNRSHLNVEWRIAKPHDFMAPLNSENELIYIKRKV